MLMNYMLQKNWLGPYDILFTPYNDQGSNTSDDSNMDIKNSSESFNHVLESGYIPSQNIPKLSVELNSEMDVLLSLL